MIITPIKTHAITITDTDILVVLDEYIKKLPENSVLAVTSKIVSICEGSVVKIGSIEKDALIEKEAEKFLPRASNRFNIALTIKNGILNASAGIDESNGNGYYILWPRNPQNSANLIRSFLQKKFRLKHVGVVITDSKTQPLRWGATGIALAHSGFKALNDYIGKPDVFKRNLHVTKANIMDALAEAAVLVMGEGREQTPLALISQVPFVHFQSRNPTPQEVKSLHIDVEDDIYGPILKAVKWREGKGK